MGWSYRYLINLNFCRTLALESDVETKKQTGFIRFSCCLFANQDVFYNTQNEAVNYIKKST